MVAGGDDQPVFLRRQARLGAETVVVFVVELDVAFDRGAEAVEADRIGAPVLVGMAVSERAALLDPLDIAKRAGNFVGQQRAGGEILEPHREPLAPVGVGRISEQTPVARHGIVSEAEVFVPLR